MNYQITSNRAKRFGNIGYLFRKPVRFVLPSLFEGCRILQIYFEFLLIKTESIVLHRIFEFIMQKYKIFGQNNQIIFTHIHKKIRQDRAIFSRMGKVFLIKF